MKLYQYPKCSTCRKATKYLDAAGVDYSSIDITVQPPSIDELHAMLRCYDGDMGKLFNRSGVRYRELGLKDILASMSVDDAIELLASDGKLIKRPFLIQEQRGVVGFKPEQWEAFV